MPLINNMMITLRIDNRMIEVKPGTRLIEAARQNGIDIPSLCYSPDLNHYSSCMVCVVRDTVRGKFIPSCSAFAEEGMDIDCSGSGVTKLREEALSMLLSEHRAECEAPCRLVCPAGLNIPLMNRYLAASRYHEAAELAFREMGLPSSTCNICPAYCENACRRKMIDSKIAISALVRTASPGTVKPLDRAPATGKRIAIAGAGATGLTAAFFLAQHGNQCTIFEERGFAGGSLLDMAADDKPVADRLKEEIERLLSSGINTEYNITVDNNLIAGRLLKEFDAIIIATSVKEDIAGVVPAPFGMVSGGDTLLLNGKYIFTVGGSARESRQVVRAIGESKRAAVEIHRLLLTGEYTQGSKRFNSVLGAINENEKGEWLKDAAPGGQRVTSPSGMEEAASEAGNCLHCDCRASDDCRLRELCDQMEIKNPPYKQTAHPIEKRTDSHDMVIFEHAKCIKCGLCVRVTARETNDPSLCFTGRGFMTMISEPVGFALDDIPGTEIEKAIEICPTGALTGKDR